MLWISLTAVFILTLIRGSGGLLWNLEEEFIREILFQYRLPASVMALMAGASLALSGLFMQNVFRNPLAGPYVLGISSGAGLGVALVLLAGAGIPFLANSLPLKPLAAVLGAFLMLFLNISLYSRLRSNVALLIFGMLAGHFVSAIVESLQYLATGSEIRNFFLWGMGNLHVAGWLPHMVIGVTLLTGWAYGHRHNGAMDVYQLGDEYARSLGLDSNQYRKRMVWVTALMAGCVTAWCGPLSFVGLAVPHLTRMLYKTAVHRKLITGTVLLGALFMLTAHFFTLIPLGESTLPVNVVCSVMGVPMILTLFLRKRSAWLD